MSWVGRRRRRDLDEYAAELTAKAIELADREKDLRRREDALFEREAQFAEDRSVSATHVSTRFADAGAMSIDEYRMAVVEAVIEPSGPLDRDDRDVQDDWCAHCEQYRTCAAYKIYWSETKRRRKQYLCSDECAYEMEDEQKGLADGEAYVRKSLGVAE